LASLFERLITLHQIKNIIEDLRQDSPQAMKRMFDLFYRPLCFYALRYAQSMPVAEEIVSDVMYKIWLNRHNGYRPETFSDYLYAATRNTAINYKRQQKSQKQLSDEWVEEFRNDLIEETPLDTLINKETQSNLNNLINSLPEQCRKIFLMSRVDDMTYDEIADQMNISTNTVKYHIKTALQKLHSGIDSLIVWLMLMWTFCVIILLHIPTHFPFSIVIIESSVKP